MDTCDDCGIETPGVRGHATDADCLAVLVVQRDRYKDALERIAELYGLPFQAGEIAKGALGLPPEIKP